jgi:hypothetical protein
MLRTNNSFFIFWGLISLLVFLSLVSGAMNPIRSFYFGLSNYSRINFTVEPDQLDEIEVDLVLLFFYMVLPYEIPNDQISTNRGAVDLIFPNLQLPPPKS